MFTDRFIKVPVDLYNLKQADMVGFNKETNEGGTYCKVNPLEIAFYRPAIDDENNLTQVIIHLKSGESFQSTLSIEKLENLLDKF